MWQHRKGIWINDQTGDLLFPWEYEFKWDASRNKGHINSVSRCVQFQFVCNSKLAHSLFDKENAEFDYQFATDHVITLNNSDFPGSTQFKVDRGNLSNGLTTLYVPYLALEKRDGKICFWLDGKIVDVQTDEVSLRKLLRLRETLAALHNTVSIQKPAAVGSESASMLRIFAWMYFIIAVIGAIFCFVNKELNSAIGIGFGVGILLSAFLGLVGCYVFAAISDNIRVIAEKSLSRSD